jgi:hypothetical protein
MQIFADALCMRWQINDGFDDRLQMRMWSLVYGAASVCVASVFHGYLGLLLPLKALSGTDGRVRRPCGVQPISADDSVGV